MKIAIRTGLSLFKAIITLLSHVLKAPASPFLERKKALAIIFGLWIGLDHGTKRLALKTTSKKCDIEVPTITLFGPTRPYISAGNKPSKVIYLDRYCSPCGKKPSCRKKYECMTEISPDLVLSEANSILKLR